MIWLQLMSHYNHWAEAAQHHSKYAVAKCCSLSCWSPCCLENVLILSSSHGCKTDQNGFESYKVDAKWFVDLYGANLENEIKKRCSVAVILQSTLYDLYYYEYHHYYILCKWHLDMWQVVSGNHIQQQH